MIIGEVRRYLRDNTSMRVSRSLRDLAYRALRAREELLRRLQRDPSVEEIAAEVGFPREDVVRALDSIQDTISLYEPVFRDNGDTVFIMDQIKDTKNTDERWMAGTFSFGSHVTAQPERTSYSQQKIFRRKDPDRSSR